MKKILLCIIAAIYCNFGYSQITQTFLDDVNKYLKTFDNGYYGHIEINDGYLIVKYASGKYSKALLSDLETYAEKSEEKKVVIKCKDNKECVYSTYTDSYHPQFGFSQNESFNTMELSVKLSTLLLSYSLEKDAKQSIKASNENKTVKNETIAKNTKLDKAIMEFNKYLETFDNGYYRKITEKDGTLYLKFKSGVTNQIDLRDISEVKILNNSSSGTKVAFMCKDNKNCMYSGWTKSYEEYQCFFTNSQFDPKPMQDLMQNILYTYKYPNLDFGKSKGNETKNKETFSAIKIGTKVELLEIDSKDKNYNTTKGYLKNRGTAKTDLKPTGDGYYKGMIEFYSDFNVISFERIKVKVLQ